MRISGIVGVLLLSVMLTGCMGGGDDESLEAEDDAAPKLPQDLTMIDADVVSYNETTVVWKWAGVVRGPWFDVPLETAETRFDMPAGLILELTAKISWEDQTDLGETVGLSISDGRGAVWCAIQTYDDVMCHGTIEAREEDSLWTARVEPNFAPETPFELELTLTAQAPLDPESEVAQNLENPPVYQPGDWWEVRVENPLTESEHTYTAVVADVKDGIATLGTSEPGLAEVYWLQATPLGQVPMDTLAWTIHGEPFEPVSFPLEMGDSWETTFEGTAVTATVQDKGLVSATVLYESDRFEAKAVYDGRARAITSFEADGSTFANFASEARWQVLDFGTNYEGPVYVPSDRTLAFTSGKTIPTLPGPVADRPGTVEEHVPEGFTDLSLALIVGFPIESLVPQASFYHEHVYAPDREQWETTVHPHETGGVHVEIHTAQQPAGAWDFERYGAGPGVSMTQGIAYTMLKFDKPGAKPMVYT